LNTYECKSRERTLFDCQDLISSVKWGYSYFSDADAIPKKETVHSIKLCKVKTDVRSTISPSATGDEIVNGWSSLGNYLYLDDAFRLDRLSQIFMNEYLDKLNSFPIISFCLIEPDIIDAMRLSYWYHICERMDSNNTFQHKKKEMKGKLRRGLLTNVEKFKISYDVKNHMDVFNELDTNPYVDTIRKVEALPKIKEALPIDDETNLLKSKFMYQWFKEVSSIIAELKFAALSHKAHFEVTFEPSKTTRDFDFSVNNIPTQVKASVIYRGERSRQLRYFEDIRQITTMSDTGNLTKRYVINLLIEYIKSEYWSQISKSLEQKTRLIFVDGTQSSVGFALNKWMSENNTELTLKKSLDEAFSLGETSTDFLPLVFSAGAIDYDYRIPFLCFKIPIIGTKTVHLDESRLCLIGLVDNSI